MQEIKANQPYIENDSVILRGLDDSDLENIKAMREDSRIYRYEPTYLPELKGTSEEALETLKHMNLQDDKQCVLGIYVKANDNAFAGLAEFYDYNLSGNVVSLGCRLLPEYWGKGIASACTEAMLDYLRDNTNVHLITAHALPNNKASCRCLEKLGFKRLLNKPENWGRGLPSKTEVYTMTEHMPSLKDKLKPFADK